MGRKEILGKAGAGSAATLGFRAHSGWATLVALAGPARSPTVIERRRIETADPGIAGSKQPYHAAEKMPLREAHKYLARCTHSSRRLARGAVRGVVKDLRKRGFDVLGCALLMGSARLLPPLAATLASHPLIHTAEGELFRHVLIHASKHCRLLVNKVSERELYARAAAELHLRAEKLHSRLNELGRLLGPPWRLDEKHAALAAWLVLAGAARPTGRKG